MHVFSQPVPKSSKWIFAYINQITFDRILLDQSQKNVIKKLKVPNSQNIISISGLLHKNKKGFIFIT